MERGEETRASRIIDKHNNFFVMFQELTAFETFKKIIVDSLTIKNIKEKNYNNHYLIIREFF